MASAEKVEQLFKECEATEGYVLNVDLSSQTVTTPSGDSFSFEVNETSKHNLLNGLDEIGLTLAHEDKIKAFETKHKATQPWSFT